MTERMYKATKTIRLLSDIGIDMTEVKKKILFDFLKVMEEWYPWVEIVVEWGGGLDNSCSFSKDMPEDMRKSFGEDAEFVVNRIFSTENFWVYTKEINK